MPTIAVEALVTATPVTSFGNAAIGQQVDRMVFRGGIAMTSPDDTFGGLSGLTMTGPNHQALFVTDRGNFVTGHLLYDDANALFGYIGVTVEPMRNSKGDVLPRQYAKDAESVDTIYRAGEPIGVRVGFEHLTRVADYTLTNGIPGGAAREVPIPDWLTDARTNETLESVCIAPPASPVAGSTLLIAEEMLDQADNHRAYLLGQNDKGELSYQNSPVVNPTECTFLPNGDLLVLERGISMLSFVMNLRRVPAAEVRAGNLMVGELLLTATGGSIDNMESLTVHTAPDGELRVLIGSDNNFNDWQRSLLLEFALVD
ncbi:esterase-like activity of phytase family protein [Devosia sp. YR412]|uniref:esterase-like activity of phytase family protein n=1 Tax=Devosia sp. YR412 TaxID=1881030 RepID=UPI00147BCCAE|nr:esterase-like activity of phytase family protein [Devosia sp. YR412]